MRQIGIRVPTVRMQVGGDDEELCCQFGHAAFVLYLLRVLVQHAQEVTDGPVTAVVIDQDASFSVISVPPLAGACTANR